MDSRRWNSFTLIELLVVMAIIALLVGILMPSLKSARESARATRCQANLHSIGQAIKAYMMDNHDYFPPMACVPTVELTVSKKRVPMNVLLATYAGGNSSVLANEWSNSANKWNDRKNLNELFHCPCDRIKTASSVEYMSDGTAKNLSDSPGNYGTYFEWQGSSYETLPGLGECNAGKWYLSRENRLSEVLDTLAKMQGQDSASVLTGLPIIYDYEPFHPKRNTGSLAGKMVLYSDFHVEPGKDVFGR
jgi:prepilin-type N-terminal cleavage/methylation domain-containing protein